MALYSLAKAPACPGLQSFRQFIVFNRWQWEESARREETARWVAGHINQQLHFRAAGTAKLTKLHPDEHAMFMELVLSFRERTLTVSIWCHYGGNSLFNGSTFTRPPSSGRASFVQTRRFITAFLFSWDGAGMCLCKWGRVSVERCPLLADMARTRARTLRRTWLIPLSGIKINKRPFTSAVRLLAKNIGGREKYHGESPPGLSHCEQGHFLRDLNWIYSAGTHAHFYIYIYTHL